MIAPFGIEMTTSRVVTGLVLFVASMLISTAIVVAFLVTIRDDHFVAHATGIRRRLSHPVARVAYAIGKNLLGIVLVVAGILMSLPGVPGQGLLTIFVGILLLDVPGKRRFELAIVSRPRVLRGINRLRARFGRAPVRVEPEESKTSVE